MEALTNTDNSTPSQRFSALELQIKNRTKILELIRKWHLGAAGMNLITSTTTNTNIETQEEFATPPFTRLSSLFFGCIHVSRNQLCEWFEANEDRMSLTKAMFNYGMGIGALLSDSSLSSSPAADFLFHLFELHLEIQLDSTATHQLPPLRLLNQRSLRKDREERLGENAAAAHRPVPRHLDKEGTRPARFSSDSFMFHEANRRELHIPTKSIDYFSTCLAFVQTMLLGYRRLLDLELVKNSMAVKRFAQFDQELEEKVLKPLFKELRSLVEYLLNHAESEMMTALASV